MRFQYLFQTPEKKILERVSLCYQFTHKILLLFNLYLQIVVKSSCFKFCLILKFKNPFKQFV